MLYRFFSLSSQTPAQGLDFFEKEPSVEPKRPSEMYENLRLPFETNPGSSTRSGAGSASEGPLRAQTQTVGSPPHGVPGAGVSRWPSVFKVNARDAEDAPLRVAPRKDSAEARKRRANGVFFFFSRLDFICVFNSCCESESI